MASTAEGKGKGLCALARGSVDGVVQAPHTHRGGGSAGACTGQNARCEAALASESWFRECRMLPFWPDELEVPRFDAFGCGLGSQHAVSAVVPSSASIQLGLRGGPSVLGRSR